jgi:hypothetical protein
MNDQTVYISSALNLLENLYVHRYASCALDTD